MQIKLTLPGIGSMYSNKNDEGIFQVTSHRPPSKNGMKGYHREWHITVVKVLGKPNHMQNCIGYPVTLFYKNFEKL